MNHKKLVKVAKTLLDVRSSSEYSHRHIAGSINIPLEQLVSRLDEFEMLEKPIITFSRNGNRSEKAITILKSNGINQVYDAGELSKVLLNLN